jgi:hypothetical protein
MRADWPSDVGTTEPSVMIADRVKQSREGC